MKRLLLLLLGGMLCAGSARAIGVDLNFVACPGNAGASQEATIDCAGGGTLTLLMTFAPAEAISDLVAVDALVDVYLHAGDIHSDATFWDFQTVNQVALGLDHLRPASGCNSPFFYANTWNKAGAGVSLGALVRSPRNVRIAAGSYRGDYFPVTANQRLFGWQMLLDAATSVEAGGSASGCSYPACVYMLQAIPQSAAGAPTTTLTGPSSNLDPYMGINILRWYCVPPDPVIRRSWSQLKSLYR
jgi:hypothetical protein